MAKPPVDRPLWVQHPSIFEPDREFSIHNALDVKQHSISRDLIRAEVLDGIRLLIAQMGGAEFYSHKEFYKWAERFYAERRRPPEACIVSPATRERLVDERQAFRDRVLMETQASRDAEALTRILARRDSDEKYAVELDAHLVRLRRGKKTKE